MSRVVWEGGFARFEGECSKKCEVKMTHKYAQELPRTRVCTLRRLHLSAHPLSETRGASAEAAVIEAVPAPLGRTPFEVLMRFKAAALGLALVVPSSSFLEEDASNRAAAALAASAEALSVLVFGFSDGAVLAAACSGKHDEDGRLCWP